MQETMRVLAVIEAATVTGPAKNLIRFCKLAREPEPGKPQVQVTIATFCRTSSNAFIEAVRQAGIELRVIPERFAFDFRVLPHLRGISAGCAPHILQTHGVKSHFLIRLARLDRRYPWIAFHHGYTAEGLKMRAYNQLDRWSLRAPRRVITVCQPFAEELERAGVARSRIEILPNSIEKFVPPSPEQTEALRVRLALAAGERVILTIGRLSREKAQIDLLRACGELARVRPDLSFRVVIAGAGPERRNLEEAAAAFGRRVTFTGQMQDVRPLYQLADVFVLPSHSEGSPNVLLEAMAAGVPIVATSVGGVPETVRDEVTALLVPADQPAILAGKILRVLEDPPLVALLRENARGVIAQRSPEARGDAIVKIYGDAEHGSGDGSVPGG